MNNLTKNLHKIEVIMYSLIALISLMPLFLSSLGGMCVFIKLESYTDVSQLVWYGLYTMLTTFLVVITFHKYIMPIRESEE